MVERFKHLPFSSQFAGFFFFLTILHNMITWSTLSCWILEMACKYLLISPKHIFLHSYPDFQLFPFAYLALYFYFLKQFQVCAEFPYTACPHLGTDFPIINSFHQSCMFITTDELTSTHHTLPKSMLYIRIHSWCYIFKALGECINTYASLQYRASL